MVETGVEIGGEGAAVGVVVGLVVRFVAVCFVVMRFVVMRFVVVRFVTRFVVAGFVVGRFVVGRNEPSTVPTAFGPQNRVFPTVRQNNSVVDVAGIGRTEVVVANGAETVVVDGRTVGVVLVVEAVSGVVVELTIGTVDARVVGAISVDVFASTDATPVVVVRSTIGLITGGTGKAAGHGSTGWVGFAVSSGGQLSFTVDGPIHCRTCQFVVSPTRVPIAHRPGHTLFHVTV